MDRWLALAPRRALGRIRLPAICSQRKWMALALTPANLKARLPGMQAVLEQHINGWLEQGSTLAMDQPVRVKPTDSTNRSTLTQLNRLICRLACTCNKTESLACDARS